MRVLDCDPSGLDMLLADDEPIPLEERFDWSPQPDSVWQGLARGVCWTQGCLLTVGRENLVDGRLRHLQFGKKDILIKRCGHTTVRKEAP